MPRAVMKIAVFVFIPYMYGYNADNFWVVRLASYKRPRQTENQQL